MLGPGRWIPTCVTALVLLAPPARAELTAWDPERVGELAKQLVASTQDLYDAFYQQPPPGTGSGDRRDFYRLKQVVRRLRSESRQLSSALGRGEGQEETLPVYEDLMQVVREARDLGARIFATEDLKQKAGAARALLNELGPYYDPDFQPLQPVTR